MQNTPTGHADDLPMMKFSRMTQNREVSTFFQRLDFDPKQYIFVPAKASPRKTLRSQRTTKTGSEVHIREYPEMPLGLLAESPDTYNDCYGQLALHGTLQIIFSGVLCISSVVTMLSIAILQIQW
jgi:hypothetical protein